MLTFLLLTAATVMWVISAGNAMLLEEKKKTSYGVSMLFTGALALGFAFAAGTYG